MKWATFRCPKCGWSTKQLAGAEVSHSCGKGRRTVALKKESPTSSGGR